MRIQEIKQMVHEVEVLKKNNEMDAHKLEDELYKQFIEYVSNEMDLVDPKVRNMAREVLKTNDTWYMKYY